MRYHYEHTPSPNYTPGRASPILAICIHHWGALGQLHASVRDYLRRAGGNTSAHYVVSAGLVSQLVDETDTAWHAISGNSESIGIECRPEMSAEDMATVAALIADIRARHGDLPLVPHSHYVATACPGQWANHLNELDRLARNLRKEPDMNPDDRTRLHENHWAMQNVVMPTLGRLDRARAEEAAWRDSMTAAITALSTAQGVDPAAVMATVEAAVTQALAGLEVTLTAQPEAGAR